MGMNFNNLVVPEQYRSNSININQINVNTNFEVEIPGYDGYYYNTREDCVYTSKKGKPFYKFRRALKIYSDKEGERFVYLLRTRDNYRGKVYLYEIRHLVYKLFVDNNIGYSPYHPVAFPGIIFDEIK